MRKGLQENILQPLSLADTEMTLSIHHYLN